MKKSFLQLLAASVMLSFLAAANAATVTVTNADDGVSNIGAPGTFYWAITNCNPGDTIAFNISGAGPFFLQVPPAGFPLVYQKHRITIDGYTQPGALANTNPITGSNSAQIKIVIDGRSQIGRNMGYAAYDGTLATSDPPIDNTTDTIGPGFGTAQYALLGVYRSTNVTIKGLAFLTDNGTNFFGSPSRSQYGIALAHDYALNTNILDALEYPLGEVRNCHIAGCWFGVNPTNVTKSGVTMSVAWINFPRHKGDDKFAPDVSGRPNLPVVSLTIGVAPGSATPREEFNVIVGGTQAIVGEPIRLRVSGNFIGFMPDGVTPYDMSVESAASSNLFRLVNYTCTFGRFSDVYASSATDAKPVVIGTDGDGVNDADEGNLWGPIGGVAGKASQSTRRPALIYNTRSGSNTVLIAGNRWGIGNDGTLWPNSACFIGGLYLDDRSDGNSKVFIGSDFASSRSAATIAAQANHIYNNYPIGLFGDPPTTLNGIVPFLLFEHPNVSGEQMSIKACLSVRGNVMVGNGLGPFPYANDSGTVLVPFTNFFQLFLDTNVDIIPILDTNSVAPNLVGTFAPGIGSFTNVIIDVYQLDPYGWTNGQAFALLELTDNATYTNGFPQGKKYLKSFPVANSGSFNVSLYGLDLGDGQLTVTANYSVSPAGTALAQTMTSEFSNPIFLQPAPVITLTRSGGNLDLSWNPENGLFTVQTNASLASPGTWGNFTVGNVAPPVSVPIGTGTLFIRLKK